MNKTEKYLHSLVDSFPDPSSELKCPHVEISCIQYNSSMHKKSSRKRRRRQVNTFKYLITTAAVILVSFVSYKLLTTVPELTDKKMVSEKYDVLLEANEYKNFSNQMVQPNEDSVLYVKFDNNMPYYSILSEYYSPEEMQQVKTYEYDDKVRIDIDGDTYDITYSDDRFSLHKIDYSFSDGVNYMIPLEETTYVQKAMRVIYLYNKSIDSLLYTCNLDEENNLLGGMFNYVFVLSTGETWAFRYIYGEDKPFLVMNTIDAREAILQTDVKISLDIETGEIISQLIR